MQKCHDCGKEIPISESMWIDAGGDILCAPCAWNERLIAIGEEFIEGMGETVEDTMLMNLEPLDIKLHCPRIYESATEFWEDSGPGVDDQCAGCGGTKDEHVSETNARIREQEISEELGIEFTND